MCDIFDGQHHQPLFLMVSTINHFIQGTPFFMTIRPVWHVISSGETSLKRAIAPTWGRQGGRAAKCLVFVLGVSKGERQFMGIFFFKLIVIWALLTFHDCQGPGVNPHGKCLPFPRNAFWWAVEKLIPRSDFEWSLCFAHLKIVGHIGLGLFFQWSRICFTWLCAGSWIDRKSKMLSNLHPLWSPVFKLLLVNLIP